MQKTKVSTVGFFSVIYLALLSGIFMYMSGSYVKTGTTDTVIRPVFFALIDCVMVIPLFYYVKISEKKDALSFLNENSRVLSVAVSFIYMLSFFACIIRTLSLIDLFYSSSMFFETDMTVFIIGITAICCAIASFGISALSRGSNIFSVFVIIGIIIVICVSVVKRLDFLNFTPVFRGGFVKFLKDTVNYAFFPAELSGLLLFVSDIEGNVKKGYFWWLFAAVITTVLISFCVVGTLGGFSDIQLFPFYKLSTIVGVGVVERLDAVASSSWMLCAVSTLSFQILCFSKCFNNVVKKECKYLPYVLCFVFSSAVCVFISRDINRFFAFSSPVAGGITFFSTVVFVPIVCIIVNLLKNKKKGENRS